MQSITVSLRSIRCSTLLPSHHGAPATPQKPSDIIIQSQHVLAAFYCDRGPHDWTYSGWNDYGGSCEGRAERKGEVGKGVGGRMLRAPLVAGLRSTGGYRITIATKQLGGVNL